MDTSNGIGENKLLLSQFLAVGITDDLSSSPETNMQWRVFYFRIAEEASFPRFDTHIIDQIDANTA